MPKLRASFSEFRRRSALPLLFITVSSGILHAIEPLSSGKLELSLKKLDNLSSVLYLAAHPDDENTSLITWLANEAMAETTYLSLTRGDGGQNLLGPDLGEKLGIIRTRELLTARKIDGGQQRFTRAIDFGYSKTPEETLDIWGKDAILADVVWTIRLVRPDIVITRFSPEPGHTHGHHTASTWLAQEAFEAAGDPEHFPEQLKWVEPWTPKRLLWNTSPWFYRRRDVEFNPENLLSVDTGHYNPLLGAAYPEIAAKSRSSHKTQGFGATAELGSATEHFEHLDGEPAEDSLFDGIETGWNRVPNSDKTAEFIHAAQEKFHPEKPWKAIPDLLAARRELKTLPDGFWRSRKMDALDEAIANCLGLDLEVLSNRRSGHPGSEVELTINAVQRSPWQIQMSLPHLNGGDQKPESSVELNPNELQSIEITHTIPENADISQPYWMKKEGTPGRYAVEEQTLIGTPWNQPSLPVKVQLSVKDQILTFDLSTSYKFNDPVHGEVKEAFAITPPAMINLEESIEIFNNKEPRSIKIHLRVPASPKKGVVHFHVDNGWRVEPESIPFQASESSDKSVEAKLIPPDSPGESTLRAEVEIKGKHYNRGFERIEYDHIPNQTIFPPAKTRLILLDVKTAGDTVGYLPGAGDNIPEALQRIGYNVETLTGEDIDPSKLARFDAVILGIRALNTNENIDEYMPALLEYSRNGGVLILQYNTSFRLNSNQFSPYPLELSRNRVTEESAPVRILVDDHPVVNFPNKIGPEDFEGWVQERGLYFPSSWDSAFTPILSANDSGEDPLDGGLLVAPHGDGWYVYSGYSWFRQLPAGVPGAYRLFANLISLGKAP